MLCVVGSPFQVMALVLMMSMRQNKGFRCCDVIVYDTIPDGEGIVERLRGTGLFSHVEYVSARYPESKHRGLQHVVDVLRPRRSMERLFAFCPYLIDRKYDVLLTSWASGIALDAKVSCVPDGETVLFDDGAGSHTGNVFEWFACFDDVAEVKGFYGKKTFVKNVMKKMLRSVFGRKITLNIRQAWLLSPMVQWRPRCGLIVFQIEMESGLSCALKVLGLSDEDDSVVLPRIIYFTLPDYAAEELKKSELDLLGLLDESFGSEFAIRVHPLRDKRDVEDLSFRVMDNSILWEAQIAKTDQSAQLVLIGAGSSAQISPKLIFGREPSVIFSYKLLPLEVGMVSSFDKMAADLLEMYSDRSRIHVPMDIEALKGLVHAI